jgi:hypothetical protein
VLAFALIVAIVAVLVVWALGLIPWPSPILGIVLRVAILLLAAVLIAQRAGFI